MIAITLALFIEKRWIGEPAVPVLLMEKNAGGRCRVMIDYNHSLLIILVAAAVTFLIRALPFILFMGSTPAPVVYLSNVLPYGCNGYAGGVLPEVHSGAGIASRPAGNDLGYSDNSAAQMEAQHTAVHSLRNGGIHAADPAGVRLSPHKPTNIHTQKACEKT